MTTPSPRTDNPGADPSSPEDRIAALREELESSADRARQAVIQYEIASLVHHGIGNEAQAVREYLASYNLDPQFRPPLFALVSIFERRRSAKNLQRLYEAEARSATTPREAASALADRAVLMIDEQGATEEGRSMLEAAVEQASEAQDLALLLEHELLSSGQQEAALDLIATRADLSQDPTLATLLRLEVARAREIGGHVEGALSVLRSAVATPAARMRVLEQLERVARRAGRHPELIVALEGRAKLAAAEARGDDQGQGSGAFSVQRFSDQARATAEAAALYRDAGRLRLTKLGDASGAIRDYDEALGLLADDPLLHYERMLACELAGDLEGAAEQAQWLLDAGVDGPPAAALHFRLAERLQASGEAEEALSEMGAALQTDPGSAAAAAMLDDLLRAGGDLAAALERLEQAAAEATGDARAQRYWEAAELVARQLREADRARELYAKAVEAATDPRPILREGYAAALRLSDPLGARQFSEALLDTELEPEERGAVLRDLHELLRLVIEDEDAAAALLERALVDEAAVAWAPDLARLSAAASSNAPLLAKAHEALAGRAADAETAAAHLCAAARARARAGDDDGAVETLRAALERSPTHPYAVALLEEVLRARGDADEVVRLLREAAEKADAPRAAETRLLLAGAAAEAADDVERAVQTYRDAADRDPTSLAPALALKRLAEGRRRADLLLEALEALSEREIAHGEPGRHTLALAAHYDLIAGRTERAVAPLKTALDNEAVGLHAAVDLALLPLSNGDGATRLEGLVRMLEHAGDEGRAGILREAAGTALSRDPARAAGFVRQLREVAPEDRWAAIGLMRLAATGASEGAEEDEGTQRAGDRGDAWLSLGHATDDPEVAAEVLLHGLRTSLYGHRDEAIDDAVILAHEVREAAPESLAAAVALDETLSAGDDPEGRADALGIWRDHAAETGQLALDSARGRALAAAGRSREALEVLLRIAAQDPDDLASWEAIRVCARDCEAWEPLVEACDRLAHLVEDPQLAVLLLEESAAVLMDALGQDDRAQRRLRRILALDAKSSIAYGRMHDLLAEREDDEGLLELVSARIDLIDDVTELAKLFYEQARLFRSLGLREEALSSLDNLLMLEPEHLGGLALLVELHVAQENWEGAVEALRKLASAEDVPDSQRRIARLGAADFLQAKLDDREGAFAELWVLHELALADRRDSERIATLAEELGHHDRAVEIWSRAVELADRPAVAARLERRLGALHAGPRGDVEAAVMAYGRALSHVPDDLEAAEALASRLDDAGRVDLSRRFERAVRAGLDEDPTSPELLRKLRAAAWWRQDEGLGAVALAALVACGEADESERAAYDDHQLRFAPRAPRGRLDEAAFDALRAPGDGGPVLSLGVALSETIAEVDGLEPGTFGLGRGDLVKDDRPLKAELLSLSELFGLPRAEVYVGGDDPQRIDLMPYYKGKPTWVVGASVEAPLSPERRFTVGTLAAAARLGVAPLVRRGPAHAATALFAAAAAAEAPLPAGEGRAGMAETTRRVSKAMPRKVRKALPTAIRALGDDGRSVDVWAHLVTRSAQHAGLLLANDLPLALRRTLGAEPDRQSISEHPDGLDLLLFWLSPGALELRRKLGLTA